MTAVKQKLARGIAWTAVSQVVEAIVSFAAMLILVRIIAPVEYGRAASAIGVLTFLNLGSARAFIDYALQLPDGEEPDWSRLWTIAFYVQIALFLVTHVVAFALSLAASLAPIAPLLHIAAFGMLLEGPAYLGATMIRRSLDIPRLRVLMGITLVVKLAATIVFALAGFGAVALVVGGTVFTTVPMAADLLFIRRWRPRAAWWRRIDLAGSAGILRFGSQRVASAVLGGGRSVIEGLVLPLTIGYEAVGLLGRAQALFAVTIGRVTGALTDTAYPFVARASGDPARLARWSGGLLFGVLLIAVPGAVFLMLHGTLVTSVIFGARWLPMIPYLIPATAAALGGTLVATSATMLLASGKLRHALTLDVVCIAGAIAAALATLGVPSTAAYAWLLGAGMLATGLAALVWLARCSPSDPVILDMIAPVVAASVAGAISSMGVAAIAATLSPKIQLIAIVAVYGMAAAGAVWVGFRGRVRQIEELARSLAPRRTDESPVPVPLARPDVAVIETKGSL